MDAFIAIAYLVVGGLIIAIIVRSIYALAFKGVDKVSDMIKREQEKKNPPKTENLADRYHDGGKLGV